MLRDTGFEMKTYLDCIPCFIRQALDSARAIGAEESVQEQVVRKVLSAAAQMDLRQSPPRMGQRIHRLIRELTGDADPYLRRKKELNDMALRLFPMCRNWVRGSDDPLQTALRLAIAGNVIDLGVKSGLEDGEIHRAIVQALSDPLEGDIQEFSRAVSAAGDILYLADNAGEIVFDRLLIEQIGPHKVTLVVKGGPIINDATRADAEAAGLTEMVEVIDNGSDAPGTVLEECSSEFQSRFDLAALVIAKGQGNYETLSDQPCDIFFALKAKCPVIARDLQCSLGRMVLRRSGATPETVRQEGGVSLRKPSPMPRLVPTKEVF